MPRPAIEPKRTVGEWIDNHVRFLRDGVQFSNSDIDASFAQRRRQIPPVLGYDAHPQMRMADQNPSDRIRHPCLCNDGTDAKMEFSDIQSFEQSDVALQIVDVQRNAPRPLKQKSTEGGRDGAAVGPVEERHRKQPLQLLNGAGDGRLGNMKMLGGPMVSPMFLERQRRHSRR